MKNENFKNIVPGIAERPVTSLKGIGDKTAGLFARLGVQTVEDLLHYYPRAYDTFREP